ncbi:cell division protein FtsW [Methylovirgula ligni]|uniref:Probable peptidoglycan glycosyltransferase FtsW n=1 Tax=Methylovirgula ligni TaxID=569860 RepID=A0A3D9YUB3_9HYPH|nr:putative peptidoglycan glycosyltransferase FtsW [Methylovirgula ligni]QAY96133.1 cell division protein FtsW [Methylovirgula ligni]REF86180.1 cell division protein FtsW [Methylovirgula ligni]
MVSRVERSTLANWWWTVDRWLLAALGALVIFGLVLTMAASPPVAERLGLPTFHFVNKQVMFLVPSLAVFFGASLLSPRHVRRTALILFLVSMALIFAALLFGTEVKGARRWIFGIQPSEFMKPCFVVIAAWAFAEGGRDRLPGNLIALLLLPATIIPLILEPDFGQTMLVSLVWVGLFFIAGLRWIWVFGVGGIGMGGVMLAYKFVPHVRARILKFIDPSATGGVADTFQVDTALQSFYSGGWTGRGPGEGTLKRVLPDAHTDFIFAVTAEEFGIIACLVIVSVFMFIVVRGLAVAARNEDHFCRLAGTGLVMLFGIQSAINMAVNLHLMPAKGMTLPFISYGGSSLISLALGMGFMIAVMRKRPRSEVAFRQLEAEPA